MRAGVLLGLRVATAMAFVATAALAVTLNRGEPTDVALASAKGAGNQQAAAARSPGCVPSRLRISLGPGARVANATRYALTFTNVSAAPCTLSGYPEVAAYRGNGVLVGDVAAQDTSVTARRVLLAPGQTAHASLESLALAQCRPVHVTGLRVVSPGSSGARYVRRPLTACASRAAEGRVYLHVRPIQAGAGLT